MLVTRCLFLLAELASRQSVNQRATLRAQWHYTSASLSSAQRHVVGCCKTSVNTGRRGDHNFVRWTLIFVSPHYAVGQDSAVGIETHYGLDVPGIEARLGRDFLQQSRPAQDHNQPPVQWVSDLFPRGKGTDVALTTHSNRAPRLKKEYTYITTPHLGLHSLF